MPTVEEVKETNARLRADVQHLSEICEKSARKYLNLAKCIVGKRKLFQEEHHLQFSDLIKVVPPRLHNNEDHNEHAREAKLSSLKERWEKYGKSKLSKGDLESLDELWLKESKEVDRAEIGNSRSARKRYRQVIEEEQQIEVTDRNEDSAQKIEDDGNNKLNDETNKCLSDISSLTADETSILSMDPNEENRTTKVAERRVRSKRHYDRRSPGRDASRRRATQGPASSHSLEKSRSERSERSALPRRNRETSKSDRSKGKGWHWSKAYSPYRSCHNTCVDKRERNETDSVQHAEVRNRKRVGLEIFSKSRRGGVSESIFADKHLQYCGNQNIAPKSTSHEATNKLGRVESYKADEPHVFREVGNAVPASKSADGESTGSLADLAEGEECDELSASAGSEGSLQQLLISSPLTPID